MSGAVVASSVNIVLHIYSNIFSNVDINLNDKEKCTKHFKDTESKGTQCLREYCEESWVCFSEWRRVKYPFYFFD